MKTAILAVSAIVFTLAPLYGETEYGTCHLSAPGGMFLRSQEGFRATPYKDSAGNPTIGYGTLLRAGDNFRYVTPGQAEKLLETRLEPVESYVNVKATRKLRAQECDALLDLGYNTGTKDMGKLMDLVNKKQEPDFLHFDHARINGKEVILKGLETRRQAEAQLYAL